MYNVGDKIPVSNLAKLPPPSPLIPTIHNIIVLLFYELDFLMTIYFQKNISCSVFPPRESYAIPPSVGNVIPPRMSIEHFNTDNGRQCYSTKNEH